jgi:nucleotide-binding universal stress UspA family protein
MRDAYNKQQQEEKTAALLQEKQALNEQYPGLHTEIHLFSGPVSGVLKTYAQDKKIDFMVMGTQGASGLAEVIIGSVTASTIEDSEIPVLAIPAGYMAKAPEVILLAVRDFDRDSSKLIPVFDMASIYDVPVHIFAFESDMDSDVEISEKAEELESFTKFLQQEFPLARLKATLHEDEDFEYAIEDYCSDNNIGMICMLTHKRGFWGKFFNRSLTKKMAFHSTIPLLAIPC